MQFLPAFVGITLLILVLFEYFALRALGIKSIVAVGLTLLTAIFLGFVFWLQFLLPLM